jgi:hypothetical protein
MSMPQRSHEDIADADEGMFAPDIPVVRAFSPVDVQGILEELTVLVLIQEGVLE